MSEPWFNKKSKETEPRFESGSVVMMVGGGPRMTVDEFWENRGQYKCIWFNKKDELQVAFFHRYELRKID